MSLIQGWTDHISQGGELSSGDVVSVIESLLNVYENTEDKVEFLIALANRGETAQELAAFAQGLRARALRVPVDRNLLDGPVVDLCGTGGDGSRTFNISTCASFVVAATERVYVAKHGNRSATSKSGGFDVLEALGVKLPAGPAEAAEQLHRQRITFLFAPSYHPVFGALANLRRVAADRGSRTIFNLLGPLLNPAQPEAQLIGVPLADMVLRYAQAAGILGAQSVMVVCGTAANGGPMDECSIAGHTNWVRNRSGIISRGKLEGKRYTSPGAEEAGLLAADVRESAAIVRAILDGSDRTQRREIVILNAAALLWTADVAATIEVGRELASEAIDSGRAYELLRLLTL
jgi:anthranilate phosphoribosyltransferase